MERLMFQADPARGWKLQKMMMMNVCVLTKPIPVY